MKGLETRLKKLEERSGLQVRRSVYLLPCLGSSNLPGAWTPPPEAPPLEPEPHVVWLGPHGPVGWKLVFFGDWTGGEREAVVEEARQEYGSCPCSQPHPHCPGQAGREEALALMAANLAPAREADHSEVMEVS